MFCANCGQPVPADARFCPSCAAPVSVPPQQTALEERKLATALFADLVGSTALAGSQDPERTRARMNRFYDAMSEEIEEAGGTVEKFVGDAVMAAFGAPAAQEDHAERALHAALSMLRRLGELFGDALSLRIGVNTGVVVVGQPREGSSFVSGDAVNVAARLEQAAGPGEILVGERTAAAAGAAFEFEAPGTVAAKGKPDGVACRRLVRALSLMRPRGIGGLNRAFVGRETELDVLRTTYTRAIDDVEPCAVTVVGEVGVGKPTLIVVRDLSSQRVLDHELTLADDRRALPATDEVALLQKPEVRLDAIEQLVHGTRPERAPDDGGGLQRRFLGRPEQVDACREHGLH